MFKSYLISSQNVSFQMKNNRKIQNGLCTNVRLMTSFPNQQQCHKVYQNMIIKYITVADFFPCRTDQNARKVLTLQCQINRSAFFLPFSREATIPRFDLSDFSISILGYSQNRLISFNCIQHRRRRGVCVGGGGGGGGGPPNNFGGEWGQHTLWSS